MLGMHLKEVPLNETIGDGFSQSFHFSFPAENQQGRLHSDVSQVLLAAAFHVLGPDTTRPLDHRQPQPHGYQTWSPMHRLIGIMD